MSTINAPVTLPSIRPVALPVPPLPVLPLSVPPHPIPPLQSGDRLNHEQYMERYKLMPPKVKAERIEGVVYIMMAPISHDFHGRPHIKMASWLGSYMAATLGVDAGDNGTIALDVDNNPQPDLYLFVQPACGGRVKIENGYVVGSPELIVEIAASSASYDLGVKQHVFRRNGVQEYVVMRTYDGEIDWFILRNGDYHRQSPDAEGILRSEVFPGLWLNALAMLEGKLAAVLAVLQTGMLSAGHAEFIAKLAAASPKV